MFLEEGVGSRKQLLQIRALHVLHQAIERTADFSVLDVLDDIIVVMNLGENLAAAQETAPGQEIKPQPIVHLSQSERFSFLVRSQPDVRHPAAVDQLLQIKS